MFFERTCVACGAPDRNGRSVCGACECTFEALPVVAGAERRVAVVLDDTARSVVAALKYRRERRLAEVIADHLTRVVPAGADAVTWVPATPKRVRRRGFDHGEEVARSVSRRTGIPLRRLLRRDARDVRQTGRDAAQRAVGPALTLRRPVGRCGGLADGLVVVVDDVVTTGASLDRAAGVLAGLQPRRVIGVAFAATPRLYPLLGGPSTTEHLAGPGTFVLNSCDPPRGSDRASTIRPWTSESAQNASK